MKPTRFMTNAPLVAVELSRRCDKGHRHVPLLERRAGPAAVYTEALCKSLCRGILKQKMCDQDKVRPVGRIHQLRQVKLEDVKVGGKLDAQHAHGI